MIPELPNHSNTQKALETEIRKPKTFKTTNMSAFQITLSNAQSKKLYASFGTALIEKIFAARTGDKADQALKEHCEAMLTEQLGLVGKKATPTKKVKAAKKAKKPKSNSPSKTDLKKVALNKELVALGADALSADASVTDIRKAIATAKKAKRAAAKIAAAEAKKAAKAAKQAAAKAKKSKAKQEKKPKGPSKTELKKKALTAELAQLDADMASSEFVKTASVTQLRTAIAAAKKAAKDAAKPAKWVKPISRRLVDKEGNDVHGTSKNPKTGEFSFLRVQVNKETREVRKVNPSAWTAEADELFDHFYPGAVDPVKEKKVKKAKKTKKTKKAKKTKADAKNDLIAKLVVAEVAEQELTTAEESEKEKTPEVENELQEEEIEEEDLAELSEEEDLDSDDEDEPEFDEEDVDEFEHSSRPGETLYKDSNNNVWNDEEELVGKYDDASDTLFED